MTPATRPMTQDTYLTAAEVREKIVACIGGTGRKRFRKWTEGPNPVLRRYYLKGHAWPFYKLSEVNDALTPSMAG